MRRSALTGRFHGVFGFRMLTLVPQTSMERAAMAMISPRMRLISCFSSGRSGRCVEDSILESRRRPDWFCGVLSVCRCRCRLRCPCVTSPVEHLGRMK